MDKSDFAKKTGEYLFLWGCVALATDVALLVVGEPWHFILHFALTGLVLMCGYLTIIILRFISKKEARK